MGVTFAEQAGATAETQRPAQEEEVEGLDVELGRGVTS